MKTRLHQWMALAAVAGLAACGSDATDLLKQIADDLTPPLDIVAGKKITDDPTDLSGRGAWGGLVLSGYGKVNNADSDGQTTSEAVPDGVTRYFGGTNNADSSGSLKYVIIAETGEAFRPDEEVQGLTVEAAGSGTKLSYVQITNSDDDGVEWFGGAASVDHLVVNGQSDDCFDIDLGYQGTIQYGICIIGATHGDKGIEADNNGDNFGALPKSTPVLANLTILGDHGNEGKSGIMHREGFGGQVYRTVISDNKLTGGHFGPCLDVDSEVDEQMFYGDVVFNCANGIGVTDADTFSQDFTASVAFDGEEDPALTINANTLAVTASFTKTNYATQLGGAGLNDTGYVGAVDPAAAKGWFADWALRNSGIEGNLPGGDFHPLQKEIEDGSLAPAELTKTRCKEINPDFGYGNPVTIFGKVFPVCIMAKPVTGDTTLTPDHVYLLDGTVNVGNGDVQTAIDKATTNAVTLTVLPGTQIFGISETASALVITRGSKIVAEGTAELPIIFGGVTAEDVE